MWELVAGTFSPPLPRDNIGSVGQPPPPPPATRTPLPPQTDLRATSAAVSNFYQERQQGEVSSATRQAASHDLFNLSNDSRLTSHELDAVLEVQRRVDQGGSISATDVQAISDIASRLEQQVQGTGQQPQQSGPRAVQSQSSEQHYNQGATEFAAGRAQGAIQQQGRANEHYRNAEAQFRQALADAPPNQPETTGALHYNLARALEQQGRGGEAAQEYERYLNDTPNASDRSEITSLVQQLRNGSPQPSLADSSSHYRAGDQEYQAALGSHDPERANQHFRNAEAQFRQAIATTPPENREVAGALHYNLARTLERQGRLGEAAEEYRQATQINPNDPELRDVNHQASMLESQAAFQRGMAEYDAAAHGPQGEAQARYRNAESHFRDALAAAPPDRRELRADLHFNLGRTLEHQGRNQEAIQEYTNYLQAHPYAGDQEGEEARQRIRQLGGEPPPAIVPDPQPQLPPNTARA